MFPYKYAYLVGNLLLSLPIWLFLFIRRRDLRREMLIVSLITGIAGPISELWYLKDYWRPELFTGWPIGIEDFIFGFCVGGISSVIYEEFFGRHYSNRLNREYHWHWFLIPMIALFIFVFNTLFYVFKINSIYVSVITFLVLALIITYFRRDLVVDSLMSGILTGLAMFLSYLVFLSIFPEAVHKWWLLNNISGIFIHGIPIEELMWAFGWGMVGGPVYEFFAGLKFKKTN